MTLGDHHDWVKSAATNLLCGGSTLWQAMCAEWAKGAKSEDVRKIVAAIEGSLL
jgi:hypothetical protein